MHEVKPSARTSRTSSRVIALLSVAALWLAMSVTALAQSDLTSISGTVKDANGAVVSGAKITVKNEGTGLERTVTTNTEGYFVISNLSPGFYTVTVEQTNFKRHQETNKKLDPNIGATIDVTLQPGGVEETISVTSSVATIQSETATVGKLVEGKQIEYLQLNGRNPLFLALLKPGVSGGALGGFSFGLTTGGLNINGSRTQDNLITFDGAVAVRTRSNGTSIGVADIEATQEVQILTANYNAEYGRSAGGQIRIVTKSGTQDFHGTFYEFLRNSALDANSWGRNRLGDPATCDQNPSAQHCRPDPFRYNQFGYSLSGPVLIPGTDFNKGRNKLFWLWGQEWVRQRRASTTTITVPTAKMRNGDFSELMVPNRFFSEPRFIRDPLKSGNCNATDQTACFPGNIIPANRLSKNGLAFLRAFPEPTGFIAATGSNNFFQERPTTTDQRKDTVSIDFYPSERHQVRWRAQLYNFIDVSAFRGGTDRAPQIIDRPNQTTSLNWTWSVTPTLVNEALIAGSRDQVFIFVDTRGDRFKRSNYGIDYPYIFPERKEIFDKIPTIDGLSGFASLDGGPYPASSTGPIYQFSDNLTWIKGAHTYKFGGYFERAGQNDFDQINVAGTPGGTNNQNGRFVFSNTTPNATGTAVANAALGLFDTYAEIGARSYTPYRGHMFEWFAQDSWKALPKLRLEFGLRHSIIQPYYSDWRNMVVFDPETYNPSIAVTQDPRTGFITRGDLRSRYNGLVIPGDDWSESAFGRIPIADTGEFDFLFRGFPKQYSKIHKSDFQPRIGFAYAFNEKNVIRGGAGRFITRLGVSDSVFLGGNPPLQPTVSITQGQADNPGGRSGNAFPLVITTQDENFRNPEAWTWNTTFEREMGYNTVVEVSYVGRRGIHGQRERNINQLPVGTCPGGQCPFIDPANPGLGRFNPDFLRPFKGFGIIRLTANESNSWYHGFQVGVNRRFSDGLSFGAAYTLSKAEDDGSAQRDVVPNAFDTSNLWGPSTFDRRHVLVVNAIYELPFFKDRSALTGKLFGGWTISAVSQFQTGTPITIGTGDDFAGVGPGSGGQLWIVTGDPNLSRGERRFSLSNSDQNQWFRVCNDNSPLSACSAANRIFAQPAAGTISNQESRGIVYGPGFQNHNVGIFKEFAITEAQRLQFRFEAFNWLNHPNWSGPNTDPRSASFGKVQGKNSERNLQFALRYSF